MWFEELTGFTEESPKQVRENITVKGTVMTSLVNSKVFECGELQISSLAELRAQVASSQTKSGAISVREVVSNAQDLHLDQANAGATFQVASQFNLLEMVTPSVTPELGVNIYQNDPTQGPACAIAAGAGTIYRNYFVKVNGDIGQSAYNQIDCLADLGAALQNSNDRLWEMRNGYALTTEGGLVEISNRLRALDETGRDTLRQLLRVGIQKNTQVTLKQAKHLVTQVYCSALPVAYCRHAYEVWADFAIFLLEAAYDAVFCAAIINAQQSGNNTLFLTLLGCGAFGNKEDWACQAIKSAAQRHNNSALDVAIVSYGRSSPQVKQLLKQIDEQSKYG